MSTPYTAMIEGRRCHVSGFDREGNLVTAHGPNYAFKPLATDGADLCRPLLEVAKLRRENGDWHLNDERLPLQKWIQRELQRSFSKRGIPVNRLTTGAMQRRC